MALIGIVYTGTQIVIVVVVIPVGGQDLKPPKLEHIFVAIITFNPFLVCRYF